MVFIIFRFGENKPAHLGVSEECAYAMQNANKTQMEHLGTHTDR